MSSQNNGFDIAIIGAGIVGLATAYKTLKTNPGLKVCIIDKESRIAAHQTGHNSGVIHSGIYYKPGSLKALNCQQGYVELLEFAKEQGIDHDVCGKVIVATKDEEQPVLEKIFQRGKANGLVGLKKISAEELREIEPNVYGKEAVWVPQAGIIDYSDVSRKLFELIKEKGGTVILGQKVESIQLMDFAVVQTSKEEVKARVVVNCAGLYSDKIGKMTEPERDLKIVPFRGEYYELVKEKEYLVNNLIYPVPNPAFPFLGVHYTRMIKGGIEAGPNAVLAFKREGYSRWNINLGEFWDTLSFPGFRKLAALYWRTGLGEIYRSYSKRAFVKALQHLIPEVRNEDLKRGGAGVRAQAITGNGKLVDDFMITGTDQVVNVWNAPSPAATSCLAIGEAVSQKALSRLG